MSTLFQVIRLCIAVPVACGSIYLFVLLCAAWCNRRSRKLTPQTMGHHTATIVVPAHNEEDVIAATLQSLARVKPPLCVVVLADNCTDSTASIARNAGVSVIERVNPVERGKGFALGYAFRQLIDRPLDAPVLPGANADVYIVVDADTQVEPDFATHLMAYLPTDSAIPGAVQGRYGVLNGSDGWRAALMSAAFDLVNHVRLLGMDYMGAYIGLKGNGMAFTRGCLKQVPMTGRSVTEDLDYAMDLLEHGGLRVQYAPLAIVRAQMPVTQEQAQSQRQRWEGGRYRVLRSRVPKLLTAFARTREPRFLGAAIDLAMPPLAEQATGCVALSLCALVSMLLSLPEWRIYAVIALSSVLSVMLYVFLGVLLAGAKKETFKALMFAPIYIVWKLGLYAAGIASPKQRESVDTGCADAEWIRTSRVRIPTGDERSKL